MVGLDPAGAWDVEKWGRADSSRTSGRCVCENEKGVTADSELL